MAVSFIVSGGWAAFTITPVDKRKEVRYHRAGGRARTPFAMEVMSYVHERHRS